MALHGNDQSHFARGEGCASDNSILRDGNSLFHNVNISSHMPNYPINAYNHDAQMLLRNFSSCTARPEFSLPPNYGLGHDNHPENNHIGGGGDQSLDFGHRPNISHPNNSSDNSAHDIYADRSQSSTGHVVRTRRRKAGGMEEARICVVCGEPASGYNFDRLTCESCKAFFRRNALKPKEKIKACGRNGDCNIEGSQRKHCPSCRLEKCIAVGMKKELILPPEKLEQRAKPKRRKQNVNNEESASSAGPSGSSAPAPPPPSILPFAAPGGGFSVPAQPSTLHHPHPQAGLVGPRVPPTHFGPEAHDFMTTRNLNNIFTDMANSRSAQSQISLFGNLSETASNAMKLHFAMATGPVGGNGGPSTTETFDPVVLHRGLPAPPPPPTDGGNQFSGPPLPPQGPTPASSFIVEGSFSTAPPATNSRPPSNTSGLLNPRPCRFGNYQGVCFHVSCRRTMLRQQRRLALDAASANVGLQLDQPDERLLSCLTECVNRIREPFSSEEPLDTQAAVTLEQEYNRMDICIRRIIRVVKMLPYFNEIGKPAQLGLLRANIYGMIVLYSSFFFERNIRKLRYPVKHHDGTLTSVTVSMLDDISTSIVNDEKAYSTFPATARGNNPRLKEDFELYKANTLAAFNHLEELTGKDDVLRMTLLAIKLFSDDSLTNDLQALVVSSKRVYLVFLWTYIRWRAGPKHLRQATELFARLHLAFIDLRALEIRMTEFAKLVSLDGLSPLMREICSSNGSNSGGSGGATSSVSGNCRAIRGGAVV